MSLADWSRPHTARVYVDEGRWKVSVRHPDGSEITADREGPLRELRAFADTYFTTRLIVLGYYPEHGYNPERGWIAAGADVWETPCLPITAVAPYTARVRPKAGWWELTVSGESGGGVVYRETLAVPDSDHFRPTYASAHLILAGFEIPSAEYHRPGTIGPWSGPALRGGYSAPCYRSRRRRT